APSRCNGENELATLYAKPAEVPPEASRDGPVATIAGLDRSTTKAGPVRHTGTLLRVPGRSTEPNSQTPAVPGRNILPSQSCTRLDARRLGAGTILRAGSRNRRWAFWDNRLDKPDHSMSRHSHPARLARRVRRDTGVMGVGHLK